MTPLAWTAYAAATLRREQRRRCDLLAFAGPADYKEGTTVSIASRCTLRLDHEGPHR